MQINYQMFSPNIILAFYRTCIKELGIRFVNIPDYYDSYIGVSRRGPVVIIEVQEKFGESIPSIQTKYEDLIGKPYFKEYKILGRNEDDLCITQFRFHVPEECYDEYPYFRNLKSSIMPGVIQTILFEKPRWTRRRASAWLKSHKFVDAGVDETDNYLRYRQRDPRPGHRKRTIWLSKADGIKSVIEYES